MLRIAERLARQVARARAGDRRSDRPGGVADAREHDGDCRRRPTLEILRPLVGMDKDEITAEAERIGTLPISNIPDQDCCTLFTPRHPATRARLADVDAAEQALPIDEMVDGRRGGGGRGGLPIPGARISRLAATAAEVDEAA